MGIAYPTKTVYFCDTRDFIEHVSKVKTFVTIFETCLVQKLIALTMNFYMPFEVQNALYIINFLQRNY